MLNILIPSSRHLSNKVGVTDIHWMNDPLNKRWIYPSITNPIWFFIPSQNVFLCHYEYNNPYALTPIFFALINMSLGKMWVEIELLTPNWRQYIQNIETEKNGLRDVVWQWYIVRALFFIAYFVLQCPHDAFDSFSLYIPLWYRCGTHFISSVLAIQVVNILNVHELVEKSESTNGYMGMN